jgi:transglutaminase superfamily protein
VPSLAPHDKVRLALRVWRTYLRVRRGLRRSDLPAAVKQLGVTRPSARRYPPANLSRAVDRAFAPLPDDPTCLVRSLVLFRLLREQGDEAEVVIGLPERPTTHAAHAWVELDGRDVGPPPGRSGHSQMARYA